MTFEDYIALDREARMRARVNDLRLAAVAQQASSNRTPVRQTAALPLTKRQREVLAWIGDGKSIADVATILGLAPATVHKHVRLARAALDVETTEDAVLMALGMSSAAGARPTSRELN